MHIPSYISVILQRKWNDRSVLILSICCHMFKRHRCSRTLVITVIVALTYTLACNIFTLYHLSKSKQNSFVHKYGLLYLGHLNTFRNWTCKPVGLSKVGLPLTALASYPGSGNTWLRHLLQQSTGKNIFYRTKYTNR